MWGFILFPLLAFVALAFAILVLAQPPRSFGVRVTVTLVVAAIGCAPLVLLLIGISLASRGLG